MGHAGRSARLLEMIGSCTPHDKYAVHQRYAHHKNTHQNQEKPPPALKDILHMPFTNSASIQ
jgi:3-deoxy-D-arabino-heptulosonate 7-phosphate (DAHP) synthase